MEEVVSILGMKQLHTPYRPQASGMVEGSNQSLKIYLAKLTVNVTSTWVEALPTALTAFRTPPKEKHGMSPVNILFGRPPKRVPMQPVQPEKVTLKWSRCHD